MPNDYNALIEAQPFYHGAIRQEDAISLLKNPGFLVRYSPSQKAYELVAKDERGRISAKVLSQEDIAWLNYQDPNTFKRQLNLSSLEPVTLVSINNQSMPPPSRPVQTRSVSEQISSVFDGLPPSLGKAAELLRGLILDPQIRQGQETHYYGVISKMLDSQPKENVEKLMASIQSLNQYGKDVLAARDTELFAERRSHAMYGSPKYTTSEVVPFVAKTLKEFQKVRANDTKIKITALLDSIEKTSALKLGKTAKSHEQKQKAKAELNIVLQQIRKDLRDGIIPTEADAKERIGKALTNFGIASQRDQKKGLSNTAEKINVILKNMGLAQVNLNEIVAEKNQAKKTTSPQAWAAKDKLGKPKEQSQAYSYQAQIEKTKSEIREKLLTLKVALDGLDRESGGYAIRQATGWSAATRVGAMTENAVSVQLNKAQAMLETTLKELSNIGTSLLPESKSKALDQLNSMQFDLDANLPVFHQVITGIITVKREEDKAWEKQIQVLINAMRKIPTTSVEQELKKEENIYNLELLAKDPPQAQDKKEVIKEWVKEINTLKTPAVQVTTQHHGLFSGNKVGVTPNRVSAEVDREDKKEESKTKGVRIAIKSP